MKKTLLFLVAANFAMTTVVSAESMTDNAIAIAKVMILSEREAECHKIAKMFLEILENWIAKKRVDKNYDNAILMANLKQFNETYPYSYMVALNCNEFFSMEALEKECQKLEKKCQKLMD